MTSKKERFWISLILRLGFGFLFLFVAIGQFDAGGPIDHGPTWFAKTLSKGFADSWLGQAVPDITTTEVDAKGREKEVAVDPSYYFLLGIPYVFAILSVPILTGIFVRPALRLGAVLLVLLGLGKYITSGQDISGTTYNFILAFLMCVGLYFLGQEDQAKEGSSAGLAV